MIAATIESLGATALAAFVAVVALGLPVIALLRRAGAGERSEKKDTELLVERHGTKRGTPTMGGLLVLAGVAVALAASYAWLGIGRPDLSFWVASGLILAFGAIGFVDDAIKIRDPIRKGLRSRTKLVALAVVALTASAVLYAEACANGVTPALQIPFIGATLPIGAVFVPFAALVIVGTANAVNLTDGLDGLAPGLAVIAFAAFAALAVIAGEPTLAADSGVLPVEAGPGAARLAAALFGGGVGFLLYNRHPARVFLGDTGSLALGGALGMLAVLVRQEVLLVIVGGVFVVEAMSVILQVWSWKRRRRRIFKCAPLHHHFEYCDWSERRITRSFWLAGAALSAVALLGTVRF